MSDENVIYIFFSSDKTNLNPFPSRRATRFTYYEIQPILISFVLTTHLQNLLLHPQWPRPISIFHGVGWVCLCRMWTAIILNPLSLLQYHISSSTTSFLFHYSIKRKSAKRKLFEQHKNVIGIFCLEKVNVIDRRLYESSGCLERCWKYGLWVVTRIYPEII